MLIADTLVWTEKHVLIRIQKGQFPASGLASPCLGKRRHEACSPTSQYHRHQILVSRPYLASQAVAFALIMSNGPPSLLSVCRSLRPRALLIPHPTLRYERLHPHEQRYYSHRPSDYKRSTPLRAYEPLSQASSAFSRARRRFSTTPVAAHGHTTPPRPGEE